MNQNGTMMESVLLQISGESQFSDLTFVVAYENDIKPVPLDEPIVAFSTKGCQIGPQLTTTLENGKIETTNDANSKPLSVWIFICRTQWVETRHIRFSTDLPHTFFSKRITI